MKVPTFETFQIFIGATGLALFLMLGGIPAASEPFAAKNIEALTDGKIQLKCDPTAASPEQIPCEEIVRLDKNIRNFRSTVTYIFRIGNFDNRKIISSKLQLIDNFSNCLRSSCVFLSNVTESDKVEIVSKIEELKVYLLCLAAINYQSYFDQALSKRKYYFETTEGKDAWAAISANNPRFPLGRQEVSHPFVRFDAYLFITSDQFKECAGIGVSEASLRIIRNLMIPKIQGSLTWRTE